MPTELRTARQVKREYLGALEARGDRAQACEDARCTLSEVESWRSADDEFRGAVSLAWEVARSRQARIVRERVMGVVIFGAPEIQTFRGQIQYEIARHPDGQPVLDRQVDADGNPVSGQDAQGNPIPRYVERLRLDSEGNPIPVLVRRYAEKTTLRVAESLGVLTPEGEGGVAEDGKRVMLLDPDGKQWSISEVIEARFLAAAADVLPEDGDSKPGGDVREMKKKPKGKKPKGKGKGMRPT